MCSCLDNIVFEGDFPPFVFCPYCGKKLQDEQTAQDENLAAEDEAAFARLNQLEALIEAKFDNALVQSIDTLLTQLTETMNASELLFPMTVQEEKIEIRHQGHFQDYTIEIFLELEDEESTLYTVSVF